MPSNKFKEWYKRGYLPHYDHFGILQSVTFRLADSLPKDAIIKLKEELDKTPVDQQDFIRRQRLDSWLDAGYGCCALSNFDVTEMMQETLLKFDEEKYNLLAWCIMPNHVHVLIEPLISLSEIVKSWKSYSGRRALKNAERLGLFCAAGATRSREFWMKGYWDRYIRSETHFKAVIDYIHNNPVKVNLCDTPANWQWSSAYQT